MFLCSFALDQICCLPREDVQETNVAFRWLVWVVPVCGDHTQQPPCSGDQWCRLHGADTGLAISFEILRTSHEIAQFDVRHDHSLADSQRHAASASRPWPYPLPECRRCCIEAAKGKEPKFASLRIEHLHACEFRTHNGHSGVENFLVERLDIVRVGQ